jgi:hypothetical protein
MNYQRQPSADFHVDIDAGSGSIRSSGGVNSLLRAAGTLTEKKLCSTAPLAQTDPAKLEDRIKEELRTWREVDLNVVRQFRQLHQPMNHRLIEADDILRSCGNNALCEPLAKILLPVERMRN